ncbi:hypothetical protein [Mesorhizobium sp. B4-1-4]|uniref:hypothetical protein n=1 Tax=Mesorhizobium sp. B4-1-4 TaxID=2589888 RepID=UPI001129FE57|nr:hypothetical protein [Mesorhizobium sp. B4-1-4]UCI32538.1 hypothetical protein FJW03_03525 [Mesorhizobium sp. B4-1-4]
MVSKTDPAREIADICRKLGGSSDQPGDKHIATTIGVEQWSRDFYEVIFSIAERLELLLRVLDELELDEDQREEIRGHIKSIKSAFSRNALITAWNVKGGGLAILKGPHAAAINALSGQVRTKIWYPKLDEAEAKEIVGLVDSLLTWLQDIQLNEQDFLRQALMEGLQRCRTRLDRLQWLGWGYTVESLRDVIGAYMALERGFPDATQTNPPAAAVVKKTLDTLKAISDKVGVARDVTDNGRFLIEIYGWAALAKQAGIAGLIGFGIPGG